MSEHTEAGKPTEYDDMTAEELEQALRETFFCTDRIDSRTYRELTEITEVLQKKKPLEDGYTVEESWAGFAAAHEEELARLGSAEGRSRRAAENETRSTRPERRRVRALLRTALVAAVVLALLLGATVTAGALGYDLWGWVPIWDSETLRFVPKTQTAAEDASIVSTGTFVGYRIREALAIQGIDEPLCPTWLPEGFSLVESKYDLNAPFFLNEYYENGDRNVSITVVPRDMFENSIFNKDDTPPEEYPAGDMTHYLIHNGKVILAIWGTEHAGVILLGNITMEEMKQIIDSVYDN